MIRDLSISGDVALALDDLILDLLPEPMFLRS
jgi:hypothetical protein